jgi:mono/diheme cytochrome c family protein
MKKIALLTVAVLLMSAYVSSVMAMLDEGYAQKGRHLFMQECRPCHMENPIGAEPAHYLGPDAKKQGKWIETFENKENLSCYGYWDDLSEEDLHDLLTYLYCGASDSLNPEKCGKKSIGY